MGMWILPLPAAMMVLVAATLPVADTAQVVTMLAVMVLVTAQRRWLQCRWLRWRLQYWWRWIYCRLDLCCGLWRRWEYGWRLHCRIDLLLSGQEKPASSCFCFEDLH